MRRPALAYCRMSAEEFDRMTPREVHWRIQAEVEREDRALERMAALACWVVNPWIANAKDRYTVGKLTRRRRTTTETDWDAWAAD